MRVLVAGATGAVGRNLLPRLLTAGHQVVGTTRTEAKAARIRALGGTAVVADGLDAEAMRRAVATTEPDVIVHEMTNLKGASDLRHFDRAFHISNRLRTEGTDHLLSAARQGGVKRFVAKASAAGPTPGSAALSSRKPMPSTPTRPSSCAARWRRSGIWKKPLRKLQTSAASCCGTVRSTAPTRACLRRI